MASVLKYVVLSCLLSTTACQRFDVAETRINAAAPVSDEVRQARLDFDDAAVALAIDVERLHAQFRDRLKMRALECAHGYSPSWLHDEEHIRSQLVDSDCFAKSDAALAQWIGLRHAGLLLAASPLRPVPNEQIAPYLVASERISEASFARQAGIAVLHTSKQHEVFDLGSGQRLQQIQREGRNFVVDISDNGRLLSLRQDESTLLLDLEHGKPLLRMDKVRDQRLFWVGQHGALYVPSDERSPVFVDLLNGLQSPIPTSIHSVLMSVPTPVAGRYAVLGSNRHAAFGVSGDSNGWKASLALEVDAAQSVGQWPRGNITADANTYIGQQNGPVLLDLRTLTLNKPDLKTLMISIVVPTADADTTYLFSHYRTANGGQPAPLLYSTSKHTLAPAQVATRLSSTMTWIPSIRRNALRDDFKLTLLPAVQTSQPPIDAATYLAQLPVVTNVAPSMEDHDSFLAALRTARASRTGTVAGVDRELAALAANAIIETVGVYEGEGAVHGAGNPVRTPGTVRVMVKKGRPVILVLSSYEPVNWVIQPEPGAQVAAVLHGGYHPSQVYGAGKARTIELGRVYAYQRRADGFPQLDAEVRQRLGKGITRFQGTYRGSLFRVGGGQD